MSRLLILTTTLLVGTLPALGQDELKYTPPATPQTPDPTGLLVRLVCITGVAIMICVGILWLVRRSHRGPIGPADGQGRIQVDGSLPLDRRSCLHMLRVDGHAIAVTTDATGMRSMTLLNEAFDSILASTSLSSTEKINAHP